MQAYQELETIFAKIHHLNSTKAVLHWDSSVVMPTGGGAARGEQLATLEAITHGMIIDPRLSDLLDEAESQTAQLDHWQHANLREMRRLWRHANAVDQDLVTEFTRKGAECEMIWRSARPENDFKRLVGPLTEVVNLVRQVASSKASFFGCSPYDALLDQYDPGRKSAEIDDIFADLERFLPSFIKEVMDFQKTKPSKMNLRGKFPVDKQKQLAKHCLKAIGFDFANGRLDESAHPFCGGIPSDIRITTRYREDEFISAMMGVQHEAGHAMYENQLPEKWREQPVGQACGMSIHESQSLLVEMQACRSREFLQYALPVIRQTFTTFGREWETENMYRIISTVEPSLIRVDADEVTYPAHIMLRYKIEKALIAGDMEVEDLPIVWNEGMRAYLGVTPPDDKMGCMQDIHWMDGSFGYFPTYTLGAMHAAQLFKAALEANPSIPAALTRGDFSELMLWLKDNVHQWGSYYTASELIEHATGQPLNVAIYKQHLRKRYLS